MQYDQLGFPIPPEFAASSPSDEAAGPGLRPPRPRRAGRVKRLVVLALLAAVVSVAVAPGLMPVVREIAVEWFAHRAARHEGGGLVRAATADLGRAIAWVGDDHALRASLLCWRAALRLEEGDPGAALADATAALVLAPTQARPRRVRALAHVMLGQPDEALADARSAVEMSGANDPEALNHRAYIRALVDRELPEALADIDAALAGSDAGTPELLDTRGFILHRLGRQQEAVDQFNLAIDGLQKQRRVILSRARVPDVDDVALRMRMRSLEHGLAVMHQHRGVACLALGLERQAAQDFAIAEKKGYDPARGVF